jgi:hypothetical protein
VIRHVDVEEFAAVMPQDNENEEQTEGKGGDDEEVDGDDVQRETRGTSGLSTSGGNAQ